MKVRADTMKQKTKSTIKQKINIQEKKPTEQIFEAQF